MQTQLTDESGWRQGDPALGDEEFIDGGVAGLSSDWSVPWSDLMMVLFVMFAILLAYQQAQRPLEDALGTSDVSLRLPVDAAPEVVYERTREMLQDVPPEDLEVALASDDSVRLRVSGSTLFDLGKADLKPETVRFLDRVAEVLRGSAFEIDVVGHTDSFPIRTAEFPTNWELSAARATRVTRYLVERGGIDPARFTVIGSSMYRPRVPNDSLTNKSLNRRVEIVITRRIFRGSEQPIP